MGFIQCAKPLPLHVDWLWLWLSGEDAGRSLLGTSDPTVWHVALDSMPPLTGAPPEGEPDLDLVETLRQEGERLIETEAAVFERDLQVRCEEFCKLISLLNIYRCPPAIPCIRQSLF